MPFLITRKMLGFAQENTNHFKIITKKIRLVKGCGLLSTSKGFTHPFKGSVYSVSKQIEKSVDISSKTCMCLCGRRYVSDMKNDDLVKAWLSEIKEDFDKGPKSDSETKGVISKGTEDRLKLDKETDKKAESGDIPNVRNDLESDIHGLTVEEMIELMKKARSSATHDDVERVIRKSDETSSGSSSDSDSDLNSSSSSSDSDDDLETEGIENRKFSEDPRLKLSKELEKDNTDIELAWADSDINTATSKLKAELRKAARWNKDVRKIQQKSRVVSDFKEGEMEAELRQVERKNKDIRTIQERFKNASDFVKGEIEDFVDIDFEEPEEEVRKWEPPVALTRGKTGVFDLEDLVIVLESARARDIAVIKIPDEVEFATYMVIVTALSYRHIQAITQEIKWIYKRKKNSRDNIIKVEGEDSKDWFAFDLGNIVLHIFTAETRVKYDLETLWTVGPQFDPKCQEEVKAPVFSLSDLPWLDELEQQRAAQDTRTSQTTSEKQST